MIELRTLGTLVLRDPNGEDIHSVLAQPKRVALLTYLAVARPGGFHRRDTLLALLWPEQDEQHARWALNQALRHLRTALGKEVVASRGDGEVGIGAGGITCDAVEFQAAIAADNPAKALGLYRGDLLDGFHVSDCVDFERWLEEERVWLRRSAARAASALAQRLEREGEPVAAGYWARQAFALSPDDEGEARRLIDLLGRIGDRSGAVQVYEGFARRLREEYLVEPAPETLASIAAVRTRQAPELSPARGGKVDGVAGNRDGPTNQPAATVSVPGSLIRRVHRAQVLGLTAVVLLLAGAGYTVWRQHGTMGAAEPVAVSGRKMLAVLPFENRGPTADDYFADGLTEAIGMRLGGVRSLGVIASQSARQYKGTNKSLAQIGRELGVQYVLQGSVRWEKTAGANRVRVSPRLIRVSDATQLWAAQYDTVLAGMFALQTSLATQVVGALDIVLPSTERRRLEAPTANLEAYDAFIRGVEVTENGAGSLAAARKALHLFERAVALDSTFVTAYAYLSITHVVLYLSYLDRDVDRLRQGKAALDRVMQLDPECETGSCCALGVYELFVLKGYDRALQAFTRAQQVRPNDHNLPSLIAHVYGRQGQWSKALTYAQEAERLNPLDGGPAAALGGLYAVQRQFAAANYYFERALALTPQSVSAHITKAVAYLNLTGDLSGARGFLPDVSTNISPTGTQDVVISLNDIALLLSDEQQTRLLRLTPAALDGDTAALALAKALVHRQRHQPTVARASFDSARVVLQEKVRHRPNEDPFYHAMLGLALAGLGQPDAAVREGERAIELLPYPAGGPESTLMPANLARIHLLLGHREQAIDLLTTVFSRPGPLSPAWLRVDPFWDPLRSSPRFQQLAAVRD